MNRRNRVNYKDDYSTIFIDKAEMKREFDISSGSGILTERAGALIMILIENIIFSKAFRLNDKAYEVTEALIDHVLLFIVENWERLYVKGVKSNPFSYFSLTIRSKAFDFLRSRYGVHRRLDLYGKNIKYRNTNTNTWYIMETTEFNEDKY